MILYLWRYGSIYALIEPAYKQCTHVIIDIQYYYATMQWIFEI